MEMIKTGVAGTGFIGAVHVEALRRLGFVEVAAISEANEELAKAKAAGMFVPKAYGSFDDMIADPEIQVVHICTPNFLHYEQVKKALLAGKHVICEKPFATTRAQAEELVALAKEKKLVNAIHLNIRYYPLLRQAKAMIENGELGEIFAVNGSYQQDWLQLETDYSWRLETAQSGESRAIADIGTHWFDTVETVTGLKIKEVLADFATFYKTRKKPLKPVETYSGKVLTPEDYKDVPINTEDYATVLLHFCNGAHGSLTVNQVAAGRKNRIWFEIYGSKRSLVFDTENPNYLWVGSRLGNNEIIMKDPSLVYPYSRETISYPGGHNEGWVDTSKHMFNKVYRYIANDGIGKGEIADYATFEDGLRENILTDAVMASSKSQKWEDVK